jgi:outer membrane protein
MKCRSAALLSALFLLSCLKPYAGNKGEGPVAHNPSTPAGQSESRSTGGVKEPITAGEKVEAGQRQDAAKPTLLKPHERAEHFAALDPDQLKRILAEISADQEREGGPSSGGVKTPVRAGEKVQAGQQRDAAKLTLLKPHDREERLAALNLDQVKQALAQIPVDQEGEGPPSSAQHYGRAVELTLQQSIDVALKSNLSLHIAELTKDALETEIPRAKALFDPTIGFGLNVSGERSFPEQSPIQELNTQSVTPFIKTTVPTGTSLLLSSELGREETSPAKFTTEYGSGIALAVIQPLLRGGRIYVTTKPIKDAEFDVRIEEAKLRAEILRVTATTKSFYYTVALGEKVIALIQAAIQRDKTLIEASQALLNAGLVTKRDVFSAEISHAKDQAKLVNAQANLETARNAFLGVLGLPIGQEVRLLEKEIGFHPVPLEVEKWIVTAIENRPEIMEVDERLSKNLLDIKVAKNLMLPQVDLLGSYGRSQIGSTFGRSLDFHGQAWGAGLVFSIPLGNAAAKSALSRAGIEQARLQQELLQRKRQVEQEVRAAAIKLQSSSERMKARSMIVEQARGKMEVSRGRFALGLATNLDIIDAQEDLLDAETDLLQAVVDYNIGIAELEASIAGPL